MWYAYRVQKIKVMFKNKKKAFDVTTLSKLADDTLTKELNQSDTWYKEMRQIAYTGWPLHGRVFLVPCKTWLFQCTLLYCHFLKGTRTTLPCLSGRIVIQICYFRVAFRKFRHPPLSSDYALYTVFLTSITINKITVRKLKQIQN